MHLFWAQNAPFLPSPSPPTTQKKSLFIFLKTISIIFIYLLAPFIVQNFKKYFLRIQSY